MLTLIDAELNKLFLFIAIGILALTCVLVLVYFIVSIKSSLHQKNLIHNASNTIRICKLDIKNDEVLYFDRNLPKDKFILSLSEFYNLFAEDDREKVINWIADLLDPSKKTPNSLESNIITRKNRKRFFVNLQVQKIDYATKVIHLENYMLRYMPVSRVLGFDTKHFLNKESFAKQYNELGYNRGITINLSFYSKINESSDISKLVMNQIMNILTPYITLRRPMHLYDSKQIIICDFQATTKQKSVSTINTIKNDINKFLSLNSYENEIGYVMGVVENRYFMNDFENLLENALRLAKIGIEDKQEVIFYEEGYKFDEQKYAQHYRTEVEKIIQDKKLKYYYQPIYNVESKRCVGYQSFVEPFDSFFESIDELKKYAIRTEDDRELFATIARNTITRFIEEKDGVLLKLFFKVSINELDYINRIFSYISRIKDTHIVIVVNESELEPIVSDSSEAFVNNLRTLKSKGYQVALLIDDNVLTLSDQLYDVFDFYLLSVKSHIGRKSASRQLPTFQGLIEKLLKYRKQIIAVDVPTWDLVELVINLGVNIISSDAIAPQDENVLPLPKKSITKLENIS